MIFQSMTVFFPIIQEMADGLSQGDNIEDSLLLQKQILKIFYALIQYTMPLGKNMLRFNSYVTFFLKIW